MGARSRPRRHRLASDRFRAGRAAGRLTTDRAVCAELESRGGAAGFPLRVESRPNAMHEVLDDLGFEALQPLSLECGGGAKGSHFEGFVTRWKGSATETDRRDVSVWLERHRLVVDFDLGKLVRY